MILFDDSFLDCYLCTIIHQFVNPLNHNSRILMWNPITVYYATFFDDAMKG